MALRATESPLEEDDLNGWIKKLNNLLIIQSKCTENYDFIGTFLSSVDIRVRDHHVYGWDIDRMLPHAILNKNHRPIFIIAASEKDRFFTEIGKYNDEFPSDVFLFIFDGSIKVNNDPFEERRMFYSANETFLLLELILDSFITHVGDKTLNSLTLNATQIEECLMRIIHQYEKKEHIQLPDFKKIIASKFLDYIQPHFKFIITRQESGTQLISFINSIEFLAKYLSTAAFATVRIATRQKIEIEQLAVLKEIFQHYAPKTCVVELYESIGNFFSESVIEVDVFMIINSYIYDEINMREYIAERSFPDREPETNLSFQISGSSWQGKRSSQQDVILINDQTTLHKSFLSKTQQTDDIFSVAVADGISSSPAAHYAANQALQTVRNQWRAGKFANLQGIQNILCEKLADSSRTVDAATTLATMQFNASKDEYIHIRHIGDSRVYRYRESDGWKCLTRDHSFIEEMKADGLTTEGVEYASMYDALTHYLIANHDYELPPLEPILVEPCVGDWFMVCTDGVHGIVDSNNWPVIIQDTDLKNWVQSLYTLIRNAGANDNGSLVVVKVIDYQPQEVWE